jgi:hypothetical protein
MSADPPLPERPGQRVSRRTLPVSQGRVAKADRWMLGEMNWRSEITVIKVGVRVIFVPST